MDILGRFVRVCAVTTVAAVLAACGGGGDPVGAPGSASPSGSMSASGSTGASSTSAGSSTPGQPVDVPIADALFGTHVKSLASGDQQLPERAGSIRLWDSSVTWRELEPVRGQIRWGALDSAVAQAQEMGARDILWVHGSTPRWAAKDKDAAGLYGPGTSSAPSERAYLAFLRKVAERYRGRITAYQVWNEANLTIFYRGTGASLARLIAKAREVLAEVDPDALLVGASTTVRRLGPVRTWYDQYATALARAGWPVDAMAVHLYPMADQGVGTRASYIRFMREWLAERGWTGPLWDTEVNYGDRRDFATIKVTVPQARAAGWVARTYIDSLALGVDRVYWYAWNDHILGIDQVDVRTGAVLPAGTAFLTVQQWLRGGRWRGCTGELVTPTGEEGAVTRCEVQTVEGPALILFSHGAATTVPMPAGATRVCQLDGSCAEPTGSSLPVGDNPILVRT